MIPVDPPQRDDAVDASSDEISSASASAALNRNLTPTPFLGSLIALPPTPPSDPTDAPPSPALIHPSSSTLYRLCGIDHEDDLIGQLHGWTRSFAGLQPRFSFSHLLGEGSQGFIFTVYDRDCRREIALKTLNSSTCDADDIARFINEAQITAQLEHPGIVPVHDFGVMPNGAVFYTMKKVQGQSLADFASTRSGSPEHRFQLIEIFIRVCETIAFAHSRGVIHRDLKPRNIMVGDYGEVMVIDWGLAKILRNHFRENPVSVLQITPDESRDDHATREGQAVGTPAYMSPEQAKGEAVDFRCDIYSLGIVLYELLAGSSPYQRGDIKRTLDQVSRDVWLRLDQHPRGRELPRNLVAVIHKAMAHHPGQRYQNVEALIADLRGILAGQAVSAYRETAAERIARAAVRHRQTFIVVALAVVLAGCFIATRDAYQTYRDQMEVARLIDQANVEERAQHWDAAERLYRRALALRPEDGAATSGLDRIRHLAYPGKPDGEAAQPNGTAPSPTSQTSPPIR